MIGTFGRFMGYVGRPEVVFIGLATAAALALFWALRGAPLGQAPREPGDDAARRHRDRMVAAAVLGLVLIAFGGFAALRYGIPWSLVPFGLGFALLIVLGQANRRRRHDSPTIRRVVQFADTALTGSLLAGVLIVGNVLAFKYGERPIDVTRERVFSLESLTINQLRSLDRPLRLTALYDQGARSRKQLDRVMQLLALYQAEAPRRVTFEVVPRFGDPAAFAEVQKRAPGVALLAGGGVLLEYGEGEPTQRVVIPNADLFDPRSTDFRGEDALTSALVRLREGKRARIAILTGHGEPSIHEMDPSKPGLGLFRARLEALGAEVIVRNIAVDRLPSELDLAILAGPRTALNKDEVERLKGYLSGGGRLLMLLDGRSPGGLADWLKAERIALGEAPIVDPVYAFRRRLDWPVAPIVGDSPHPIVASMLNEYPVVFGATPITIDAQARPNEPANPRDLPAPVLRTSPRSWAESDTNARPIALDPPRDTSGPHVVGVASSKPATGRGEPRPRFVLFSTAYLADNTALASNASNLNLLLNSVNWLRGRADLQGLAPRRHVSMQLAADPGTRLRLVLVPTVAALAVILGLGAWAYLARRA